MGTEEVPTPGQIGRLTVGHNINSTQLYKKLTVYTLLLFRNRSYISLEILGLLLLLWL
jgi:hypothetical protein